VDAFFSEEMVSWSFHGYSRARQQTLQGSTRITSQTFVCHHVCEMPFWRTCELGQQLTTARNSVTECWMLVSH